MLSKEQIDRLEHAAYAEAIGNLMALVDHQTVVDLLAMLRESQKYEADAHKWRDYVATRNQPYDQRNVATVIIEGLNSNNDLMRVALSVPRAMYDASNGTDLQRFADDAVYRFKQQLNADAAAQRDCDGSHHANA